MINRTFVEIKIVKKNSGLNTLITCRATPIYDGKMLRRKEILKMVTFFVQPVLEYDQNEEQKVKEK